MAPQPQPAPEPEPRVDISSWLDASALAGAPPATDETLARLLTGNETQTPLAQADFSVLSSIVSNYTDPSSVPWSSVKKTKNMEVMRADRDGVTKFLTVMSPGYGKGIPIDYPVLQFRDEEFFLADGG